MIDEIPEQPAWPVRTVLLLAIGAIAAWTVQQLVSPEDWRVFGGAIPAWRVAVAAGVGAGAFALGFGLSRVRWAWTIAFALALGLVAGLIVWWNGQPGGRWSWPNISLFLAIAIALPLFQVARDEGRRSLPYTQIHGHAWTNIVLWCACWAFTGLSLLLSHLLGELFALIGIDGIRDLLRHNWPNALIIGAAFGAALGMLRDRVVRLLQRVVTSVLAVLAPVLAVALGLFVLALPFTGLKALWNATQSPTPTLLACVIGGLILINAVVGHGPDDEASNPLLRWSAMVLGVVILPLAAIAAIAMGQRLGQYGVTPDRLWGLVCVAFAVAYGFVYFVAIVRKRSTWAPLIRRDNIRLAFATMAVALVLATPILGFNAISVGDQVARLKSGKVPPEKFDWAALGYDYGEPGRVALKQLASSPNPAVKSRAEAALKADSRSTIEMASDADEQRFKGTFDVKPAGAALPEALRKKIVGIDPDLAFDLDISAPCKGSALCRVYLQPDGASAAVVGDGCMTLAPAERVDPKRKCSIDAAVFVLREGKWVNSRDLDQTSATKMTPDQERASLKSERDAIDSGEVEVRDVGQQQLFIGNKPVGQPFKRP